MNSQDDIGVFVRAIESSYDKFGLQAALPLFRLLELSYGQTIFVEVQKRLPEIYAEYQKMLLLK